MYGRAGMNEHGLASKGQDDTPALGEQPTLAAAPGRAVPPNSGPRLTEPEPTTSWTGKQVDGRYLILEQLGEGGMGVVYVAEHVHLKKRVAFKVIHPDLAAHEELLLRFKREALATGQLDHPHIAAAIDFGVLEGGGAFMVMPLVRGLNLQGELDRSGPFDPRRAARIGSQIADALSAAHAVGIVHRDLKPDNILIERRSDGSEAAKVLDFGVASLAGRPEGLSVDARPLTQAGTILGTPGYMSPEQASAGDVDHRTDLYALGVILWELCRGERLFDGDNITQIFAKQFKTLPPALDLGLAPSGRELSALVASLLAWDKNARPASAAEVRDALRRVAELPGSRLSNLPALGAFQALKKLLPYRRHATALTVGIVLFLFFALRGDEPKEAVLAPEVPPTALAPEPPAASKPADKRRPFEAPVAAEPVEDQAQLVEPSRPSQPVARRASRREAMPAVFVKPADTLLNSRSRDARKSVAGRLLRSQGVPDWLLFTAELELANRCADKKGWLDKIRAEGDPRVLPALERLADQPKHGCSPFRLADCLSCLRRELDQTIGVLSDGSSPR
ncbi:MAG: Serine/threonine protein kinase [Myxococcaceae bacterium]|nr:Serine/threonine protein kinase [Myxococcaceae bacterium]